MKDFGRWFTEQGPDDAPATVAAPVDDDELPDGLYMINGLLTATCRGCGKDYEWPAEAEKFPGKHDYYNLCGGQFCCP